MGCEITEAHFECNCRPLPSVTEFTARRRQANLEGDAALARHVTYVHRYLKNPELEFTPLDITLIKNYVAQARLLEPYVPEEISGYIVESYVQLRMEQNDVSDQTNMTARQLLSILRLTQV